MNPREDRKGQQPEGIEKAGWSLPPGPNLLKLALWSSALVLLSVAAGQTAPAVTAARKLPGLSYRSEQARRFLAQRGWSPGQRLPALQQQATTALASAQVQSTAAATWSPLGPAAVLTPSYGLVSGRITSVALDPADASGNHIYVGTTGGGVWTASNAAVSDISLISFSPLTDSLSALGGAADASISIGALTVQPGGTGVILAGTGDPNDVLDSYYGAGILRSTDGGTTWNLISHTSDMASGLSMQNYYFSGEGIAGFAWSTVNPQLVVAAVSQAYEGELVDATQPGSSMQGLYYSQDSGASWHLATMTDDGGMNIQGPIDRFAQPDGNAATAVVWNPIRKLFIAAVRYHGYYQSADGVTWTRLSAQPGAGLTAAKCPTNADSTGSIACPIFRGALAVNPQTGDTFAWTIDLNDQDQGLWQDQCSLSGNSCANANLSFSQQWSTAALEANTEDGPATVPQGKYNLTLAAVPSGQETMLLAGANDLWQSMCPVALGCQWRNTTNSTTCMSAKVGEFQHALAWNAQNPLEIFVGNDSGLWRSMDAIAESGSACSANDASHFQNLNGGLGSLAEVQSISDVITSPYAMMAGLGVNGTAGANAASVTADWPQILGGYGGPVAIDPQDSSNWYVNDQAGVAIYRCAQPAGCTPAAFGTAPVVSNADVGNDGLAMQTPAPFLVDSLDHQQLLVGTCRVWRGPAWGGGWTASSAISPILDSGSTTGRCQGDALIRSMTATVVQGTETVYVGTYGSKNGGATLPGHILSATFDPSKSTMPVWHDLALNPVANDKNVFNLYGLDISSIAIDPHDPSGNTVYAAVSGVSTLFTDVQSVYRSSDGGATWNAVTSNLPNSPVNAVAVDPQSANTVYVATDLGVFYTTEIAACALQVSKCWSAFGTGLPAAPVQALSASPAGVTPEVLVAGTYGRGIWQTNLWSAEINLSAASAAPSSLLFRSHVVGTSSPAQIVTIANTGNVALLLAAPAFSGNSADFSATGDCVGQSVPVGGACSMYVSFTPQATGQRTAQMTLYANIYGGQLSVDLNGTGLPAGALSTSPLTLPFGLVETGTSSSQLQVTLTNSGTTAISLTGITATAPFKIATNACGTSLAANSACQVQVVFAPTQAGFVAGLLTFTGSAGTQTVQLSGTGGAPPTDVLSATSLSFPSIAVGQISAGQAVTITNIGDLPLHVTSNTASAGFQQASGCISGVAAHSACDVNVQFAPTQTGAASGTLTIVDELGTKTVALSGTGVPPGVLTVTPTSLTFAQQQPGVASAPEILTVTNNGSTAVANIGFQLTGPAATSYSVAGTTCGALLNVGANCTVQIVFTPAATGTIAASLSISSSTLGVNAATVPLNGAGQLASGLETNPAQLPFSAVIPVGQSSTSQPVTVINSSRYSISAVSVTVTPPFSLAQNTCSSGLGAGATCTASVLFSPNSSGSAAGTLIVSSSDVATPATVALSGTGFSFTVTPSGPTSETVTSGQQAIYKLLVTPNGAQGAFTFQCGTLPSNALCIFNPTSETLAAGVQGTIQVQIYTGNSGATAQAAPGPALGSGRWPLACGLLLLPLAIRRNRGIFLMALLAVLVSVGVCSCAGAIAGSSGGGSGGQGSGNKTPAGTYSVPVTVSSNGISQSVTLTLTVD